MCRALITILLLVLPSVSYCGNLFTFDKNKVQMVGLQWIQSRYPDLAKITLTALPLQVGMSKDGKLLSTIKFSYEAKNEYGISYACATVDENASLVYLGRDIGAYKAPSPFGLLPETPGCWGAP